jgi:hypothetical protein
MPMDRSRAVCPARDWGVRRFAKSSVLLLGWSTIVGDFEPHQSHLGLLRHRDVCCRVEGVGCEPNSAVPSAMLRESHKHTKQETRLARLALDRTGAAVRRPIKLRLALLNEWCDRVARTHRSVPDRMRSVLSTPADSVASDSLGSARCEL